MTHDKGEVSEKVFHVSKNIDKLNNYCLVYSFCAPPNRIHTGTKNVIAYPLYCTDTKTLWIGLRRRRMQWMSF